MLDCHWRKEWTSAVRNMGLQQNLSEQSRKLAGILVQRSRVRTAPDTDQSQIPPRRIPAPCSREPLPTPSIGPRATRTVPSIAPGDKEEILPVFCAER